MTRRGRPKKVQPEHLPVLREIVIGKPLATLTEVRDAFISKTGIVLYKSTLSKALREAGVTRHKGVFDSPEAREGEAEPHDHETEHGARYGYQARHRQQAPEQRYPSCLTDAEWTLVSDIFDGDGHRGLPPSYSRRQLVDACCYVVRSGCSWRMLPTDFPPWQNVYRTFRRWSEQGKFERMHDRLRAQWRAREGRDAMPSAAVLDAQSTRHSPQGGTSGYDAGKKVKGRKRHVLVDTLGLILAVSVTAASVQDRDGAHPVMANGIEKYAGIATVFVDTGYAGRCAQTIHQQHGIAVEVVRHPANANVGRWCAPDQDDLFTRQPDAKGFMVLPKRWVVERTHAWIEKARRLVMHHDRRTEVSEAWVWLAAGRQLLSRLTNPA
nr:IS5 family transposase [uncultured Halomonas sp.]